MANPHSAVPNPVSNERSWKMPTAVSVASSVTAKHAYVPARRWCSVHEMKRSNPSSDAGGGEMNRATSSAVSMAKSDGASDSAARVT